MSAAGFSDKAKKAMQKAKQQQTRTKDVGAAPAAAVPPVAPVPIATGPPTSAPAAGEQKPVAGAATPAQRTAAAASNTALQQQQYAAAAAAAAAASAASSTIGGIGSGARSLGDVASPATGDTSSGVLGKRKVSQLLQQVAPGVELDEEVFDLLLEVADDFIESTTTFSSQLARHRNSQTLDVADLKLHLEKNWGIRVPGFGLSVSRTYKRGTSSLHRDRLAMVKQTIAHQTAGVGRK